MNDTTRSRLAVVHQGDRTVSLHELDPDGAATGERDLVDLSAVPGEPHEARGDPGRRLLYVAHTYLGGWYGDHSGHGHLVSVVDVDSGGVLDAVDVGAGPHDLWIDTARDRVWATVEASAGRPGGLVAVDPSDHAVVTHIDAGTDGPHWFTVTPDGTLAYTANKHAPFVSVLDLDTGRLVARIALPGGSEGIAAGPDGRVFVAGPCRHAGGGGVPGVRVVAGDEVVDVLDTPGAAGAVHVTAGGLLLATTSRPGAGTLRVWSATTLEPLGEVPVGGLVLTITSSPDGRLAFVADMAGDEVAIVELPACRVVASLTGVTGPHGMALVPPHAPS